MVITFYNTLFLIIFLLLCLYGAMPGPDCPPWGIDFERKSSCLSHFYFRLLSLQPNITLPDPSGEVALKGAIIFLPKFLTSGSHFFYQVFLLQLHVTLDSTSLWSVASAGGTRESKVSYSLACALISFTETPLRASCVVK